MLERERETGGRSNTPTKLLPPPPKTNAQVDASIPSTRLFDVSRTEALLGRPLRDPEATLCDMVQAVLDEDEEREGKEEG